MNAKRIVYYAVTCLLLAVIAIEVVPWFAWHYASISIDIDY
jgi:hypothetical protein